jgi:hypothetical protein
MEMVTVMDHMPDKDDSLDTLSSEDFREGQVTYTAVATYHTSHTALGMKSKDLKGRGGTFALRKPKA